MFEDRWDVAKADEYGGGEDEEYEITQWGNHRGPDYKEWLRWYRNKREKKKAQPRTAGNVDEEIL